MKNFKWFFMLLIVVTALSSAFATKIVDNPCEDPALTKYIDEELTQPVGSTWTCLPSGTFCFYVTVNGQPRGCEPDKHYVPLP